MKVRTLGRNRVEVTTPNGTILLYKDDVLLAAIWGDDLYFNFRGGSCRDEPTRRAVAKWSREHGHSGGGERSEEEIMRIAMRPVDIVYGDYSRRQPSRLSRNDGRRS